MGWFASIKKRVIILAVLAPSLSLFYFSVMNISHEHNALVMEANSIARWAFVVSVISLLVSGGSLYYAYQQTILVNQQNMLFDKQTVLFDRQTQLHEAEQADLIRTNVVSRIEVIQGVKSEVRLVIENRGRRRVVFSDLFIDGFHITDHPLFEKKQFAFVRQAQSDLTRPKMSTVFLDPGANVTFLTVASVPTTQTSQHAIPHHAITVRGTLDSESRFYSYADFSRQLVFPNAYLQWRASPHVEQQKQ